MLQELSAAGSLIQPIGQRFRSALTEGVTPDPIPNSVVKPLRADGTNPARDRESRTALRFFIYSSFECGMMHATIDAPRFIPSPILQQAQSGCSQPSLMEGQ